ncbi:hypothetical protein JCM3775_004237 [Rhodotorula graminis]
MFTSSRPSTSSLSSSKPRPRANTLTSPAAPPPTSAGPSTSLSPSLSRSYRQPIGTGSLRRQQQQLGVSHGRSRSLGDVGFASSASATSSGGRRRAVFCDVVVDDLELGEDGEVVYPVGPAGAFLNTLGTFVHARRSDTADRRPSRPATPAKSGKIDHDRVRQSLHELWATEESYLRKISSLQRDYAAPLREFAKSRSTAIVPLFEANHLFVNIDELVPLAAAFEADLRDVVGRSQRDKASLPTGFGAIVLHHIERMQNPYKIWLSNVRAVEMIRSELDRSNSSFREFIERTQIVSREMAQTSGGFKEFLAEPHQRIARYRLMLDPIVASLPQEDPNVDPLRAAIDLLGTVCSMEVDDATKRAAVFWALGEAVDGLPGALVGFDRHFVAAIDVDEVFEVSDPRTTTETLRCTLWLFSDRLLITKRPRGSRTGKAQAGLDDLDRLVQLYETSHLSSSEASLLGSPKRLRKGVLAYRGLLNLAEVVAVDLGSSGSGGSSEAIHELGLLLDDPPVDQTSRWNGRPSRRYVVAETYASEQRGREKERFLASFGDAVLQQKLKDGARAGYKGRLSASETDASEVYWALWDTRAYEGLRGNQKGKIAMHLVEDRRAPSLSAPGLRPNVLVRVTPLHGSSTCSFEVKSKDAVSGTAENIAMNRIPPAIVELGTSYGLFSFPTLRPISDLSRSRPRSALLSVVDLFTSGGGLKRGNSTTSRGSSSATTTVDTPRFSTPTSPQTSLSQSHRRPLSKKSAPNLYASQSATRSTDSVATLLRQSDSGPYDGLAELGSAPPVEPLSTRSRNRPRRSMSLPPPISAEHVEPTPTTTAASSAPAEALEDAPEDDAPMDAIFDSPRRPLLDLEAPDTSPMTYRVPERSSSRRRMIGPRDMRSPVALRNLDGSSPAHLPFARERSPTPLRQPHVSDQSTATYRSSPSYSETDDVSFESQASSTSAASKRPRPLVEASPRPAPAKKVASLAGSSAGPRAPPPLQPDLFGSARKSSGGSLLQQRLVSSSSSVLNRTRPTSRRVASGASTVRGPATPPRDVDSPDVFSSPAPPTAASLLEDAAMADLDQQPFHRLRKHVDDMRLKLAREVAADKENDHFVSPTALTRSPQTRNVFGKTIFGSESAFSSPQTRLSSATKSFTPVSETRPRARHLDKHVLAEWTRKLAELVDDAEAAAATAASKPRSPLDGGGNALEVAMLEQERDLLAAELVESRDEVKKMHDEVNASKLALEAKATLESALASAHTEIANLRQAYGDICGEANTLLEDFNLALEEVTLAAQAEPTATGEYVDLTNQVRASKSAQFRAEHDLRAYRRSVQADLEGKMRVEEENAQLRELCRRHGLLA